MINNLLLIYTGKDIFGRMQFADWEEMARILAEQGLMANPPEPANRMCTIRFTERLVGGGDQ